MNRRQIMAEVLAHLEAERFAPVKPQPKPVPRGCEPITPEQAAENLAILTDAIGSDETVIAWRERGAA